MAMRASLLPTQQARSHPSLLLPVQGSLRSPFSPLGLESALGLGLGLG
jgi:hypothetical protein